MTNNNTREAFITALKELMKETTFQKISVADLCEKCNKNRKSFYYHFKDKYDLANKAFDADFPLLNCREDNQNLKSTINALCCHLDGHRLYYKKLLKDDGQNSFSDYLRNELREYFETSHSVSGQFACGFWGDAVFYSIKDWLLCKNNQSSNYFCLQLMDCVRINNTRTN